MNCLAPIFSPRNLMIAVFALAILLLPASQIMAGTPNDYEVIEGVCWFKIAPEFQPDMPAEGAQHFGYAPLDKYMDSISAIWVARTFPHCQPPRPNGVDLTRIYTLEFPPDLSVEQIAFDLSAIDGVEYAQPKYMNHIALDHNDPFRNRQYALDLLQANEAHDITTGSEDVVIAISDNGTDMDHPDLLDNIWDNPNDEENGQDDDNNGYTDDIHGWDMPQDDNDPNDDANHGHGTHTAGIASAVTNNETGISSVAYSCKLMIVRCGEGNGISHGYEGIQYAVDAGADIINCSWGGGRIGQAELEVIEYATENDVLMVCAAGNFGTSNVFYPAGFEDCVSVAATNQNDIKANFSNYGDWVDIAAPGVDIYSTFLNGAYSNMDGTSMACPYVASVAGLIRSEYPDMNIEAVKLFMYNGVDRLDDARIGAGRVNAYLALRAMEYPVLEMGDLVLSREQNGNNRVDPGETVQFTISLRNLGRDAEEIHASMEIDDETIEFIVDEVDFPNISTGELVINEDNPFVFSVDDDAFAHTTNIRIHVTAQPNDIEIEQEFELLIGHPAVLVVDDDGGGQWEGVFDEALTNLRLGFRHWSVLEQQAPSPEEIITHPLVIWITGDAFPPLDYQDQFALRETIESGGNILLMGKYIGDVATPDNRTFLREQFGVYHEEDSVYAETVRGMPGDRPVPEDIVLQLGDPNDPQVDSLSARVSPSTMRARWGADTLMVYEAGGERVGAAGIYWHHQDTGAHTIYLGYNLEMACDLQTSRGALLAYFLDWMTDYRSVPGEQAGVPGKFTLNPAFPNPFNGKVSLNFTLPNSSDCQMVVVDGMGRQVASLLNGMVLAGDHNIAWNADDMPSGVYFARMQVKGMAPIERRLVLLK